MELLTNAVRIALAALAVWYLFRKAWKPMGSLMLVLALTFLPALLEFWVGIRLDTLGICLYLAILIMTLHLGSTLKFYDKFVWWDRIIHLVSGVLLVNVGVAITQRVQITPTFGVVLFAVSFSLAGHCVWELLEYATDCFSRSDNQRWQKRNIDRNHKPEAAIQPAGLVDTMNDLLMGLIGAVVSSIVWFLILR